MYQENHGKHKAPAAPKTAQEIVNQINLGWLERSDLQTLVDQAREEGRREGAGVLIAMFPGELGDILRVQLRLPTDPPGSYRSIAHCVNGRQLDQPAAGKAAYLRYIADRIAYQFGKHFNLESTP